MTALAFIIITGDEF